MSYQRAIELWTQRSVDPPPLARIERGHQQGLDPQLPQGKTLRGARWGLRVAALGFAAMAVIDIALLSNAGPLSMEWRFVPGAGHALAVLLPIAMLLRAERWLAVRELGRQMLARAVAWSSLLIGVLVAVWGVRDVSVTGPVIALGSAAALLALGGRGLGLSSGSFRPLAFRGQLLVALVLAMADAQTLLFSGIVDNARLFSPPGFSALESLGLLLLNIVLTPSLWGAAAMMLAVWGLLRLRTWALLLNLVLNVVVGIGAMTGVLAVSLPVAGALVTTAGIQLLLAVPILAAALGDNNPDRPPLGRAGARVARLVIAGLAIVSVFGLAIPDRLGPGLWRVGWIAAGPRHDIRGISPQRSANPIRRRSFRMGGQK